MKKEGCIKKRKRIKEVCEETISLLSLNFSCIITMDVKEEENDARKESEVKE